MAAELPPQLYQLLAANLPREHVFTFHHLRSHPASCDALFAAAPGGVPEPTVWESQLLSVSIEHEAALVQVLAIEVLLYTTDRLITVFVSKADSTGYLHLAKLRKSSPSRVQSITTAFLHYLIAQNRDGRRLVLSLFARAQAQYLFPGSVDNRGKHVLDDRQLIRWWCRIVDDVLARLEATSVPDQATNSSAPDASNGTPPHLAYLVVPGLDAHETRTYVPPGSARWATARSPLRLLAVSPAVPERCLIPRFPDDPKARFALDLDAELPENAIQLGDGEKPPEPSKTGKWRSVSTLEQFWELMAFRQECSAGRVVGFLWAALEPVVNEGSAVSNTRPDAEDAETASPNGESEAKKAHVSTQPEPATPPAAKDASGQPRAAPVQNASLEKESPPTTDPSTASDPKPASIPAIADPPAPASAPLPTNRPTALAVSSTTYSAITTLLDKLDYADIAIAKISTHRFLVHASEQAGVAAAADRWGVSIRGTLAEGPAATRKMEGKTEVPTMLVGRKRKKEKVSEGAEAEKKAKVDGLGEQL